MPISPNQGSTSGGTTVTVTGVNLANATAVHFGDRTATITSNTPTSVTVVSPAGCGVAEVDVTTSGGTSNSLAFFYIGPPIAVSLTPDNGPTAGGSSVTVDGYGLSTAGSVTFGSTTATPTVLSDSRLSVVVPAGVAAGSVEVTVTTSGGTSAPLAFTYLDTPTITTLSPASGPASGGTSVTISGTNLATVTGVTVGGVAAAFDALSGTLLAAVTPPGSVGAADVVVTTEGGSATAVGGHTYVSGPGI